MITRILLVAGILNLATLQTWSAERNAGLENLTSAIQQALDQKKESNSTQSGMVPDAGRMLLSRLRGAMSRNDTTQIETSLQELSGVLDSAPPQIEKPNDRPGVFAIFFDQCIQEHLPLRKFA